MTRRLSAFALAGLGLLAARPALSQTVQLCDRNPATFPTVNVPNNATKSYVVQNNFWNAAAAGGQLCISVNQANGNFSITSLTGSVPTTGGPTSYPSIFKGCHWGNCTNNSGMPIQVSNIGTANAFWSITPVSSGQWDAALDIWFDTRQTITGQPDGTEIMIWLNHLGPPQPFGSVVASSVAIGGTTWNVWRGVLSGSGVDWNVVSYVRVTPATSLGTASAPMNLLPFFNDASSRGFLPSNWWLQSIQAGFEPWSGGTGLASSGFSATVTAGGTGQALSLTKAGTGSGTVTSSPGGINCGTGCGSQSASFANGTSVTLTASAASGSTFVGWGGACSGTGNCTVSMTQARSVTATFNSGNPGNQTLSLTKSGMGTGTVTSSPGGINCGTGCSSQSASFASGASVTLTASAASGSTFAGWSGACSGTGSCTVSMTQARSVTATFNGGGGGGVTAQVSITDDWGAGYCATLTVTNGTTQPVTWQVTVNAAGSVYNIWNAVLVSQTASQKTIRGMSWNATLQPGQSTQGVGFCANR